jgi:ribokinase
MTSRIAVIGSLTVDMAVQAPRLPHKGENLQAHAFKMGAGGKGANAAAAISRMGGEALIIGCIGDDELGRFEQAALQAEGIETVGLTMVPGAPTDVAVIIVDDGGDNSVLAIIKTNLLLTGRTVESALASHWGALDAILVNFDCAESAVAAAVQSGKAHNIPVVVDAGPIRGYGPETWRDATVLSPNADEAAALASVAGVTLQDDRATRRAARGLLAAGPGAVVLKLGGRGALLLTRKRETYIGPFPVKVVDTTGAGDAFSAALTLALAEGQPMPEAVRFGNAAGALATTRFGTLDAMPTRTEVNALLSGSGKRRPSG